MMPNKSKIALSLCLLALVFLLAACNAPVDTNFVNTKWVLKSINDKKMEAGYSVTLIFEEKLARGKSVCNDYSAGYGVLEDNRIFFTPRSLSNRICMDPPGLMETEMVYLVLLGKATKYDRSSGQLQLYTDKGDVLVFYEAP